MIHIHIISNYDYRLRSSMGISYAATAVKPYEDIPSPKGMKKLFIFYGALSHFKNGCNHVLPS